MQGGCGSVGKAGSPPSPESLVPRPCVHELTSNSQSTLNRKNDEGAIHYISLPPLSFSVYPPLSQLTSTFLSTPCLYPSVCLSKLFGDAFLIP